MTEIEKAIAAIEEVLKVPADILFQGEPFHYIIDKAAHTALVVLKEKAEREANPGKISDGYHTFDELYHHRAMLFSVICNDRPNMAWKSKQHHDGTMYNGMFIVGVETPDGQATYHYDIEPYWDRFNVKELPLAPEWDGHTPSQAIERISSLSSQNTEKSVREKRCKDCAESYYRYNYKPFCTEAEMYDAIDGKFVPCVVENWRGENEYRSSLEFGQDEKRS